jgi:hypothetical protein
MAKLVPGTLLLATISMACGSAEYWSGSEVQPFLDEYATEVAIGGRVSDQARERYRLVVAPYVGYRDSTYTTLDGLRDLHLFVDEYVDDGRPRVSRRARIEAVGFIVRDSLMAVRTLHRLTARVGLPLIRCQESPIPVTVYMWRSSGDGIQLVVRWPHRMNDVARYGIGELRFGKLPGVASGAKTGAECRSV